MTERRFRTYKHAYFVRLKRGESLEDIDKLYREKYNATDEEFINGTSRRNYLAAIVSHPLFKAGNVYHVYLNKDNKNVVITKDIPKGIRILNSKFFMASK